MRDLLELLSVNPMLIMRLWRVRDSRWCNDKFVLSTDVEPNYSSVNCADIFNEYGLQDGVTLPVLSIKDGYNTYGPLYLPVDEVRLLVSAAEALGFSASYYLYTEHRTRHLASTSTVIIDVGGLPVMCSIIFDNLYLFDTWRQKSVCTPLADSSMFETLRLKLLTFHRWSMLARDPSKHN